MIEDTIYAVLKPHAKSRLHERMNIDYAELHKEYGEIPILKLIWNPIPCGEKGKKKIVMHLIDPNTNNWREAVFVLKKMSQSQRRRYARLRPISEENVENERGWDEVKYEILTVHWDSEATSRRVYSRRNRRGFNDGSV